MIRPDIIRYSLPQIYIHCKRRIAQQLCIIYCTPLKIILITILYVDATLHCLRSSTLDWVSNHLVTFLLFIMTDHIFFGNCALAQGCSRLLLIDTC